MIGFISPLHQVYILWLLVEHALSWLITGAEIVIGARIIAAARRSGRTGHLAWAVPMLAGSILFASYIGHRFDRLFLQGAHHVQTISSYISWNLVWDASDLIGLVGLAILVLRLRSDRAFLSETPPSFDPR